MARGRKKEALTPEERLQAALVPESEQPYKVPGNWCWVRVSSVCEFERGITFPASAKEKEPANTNIPCLRTANVQDELEIDDLIYVDKAYMKGNEAKLVQKDDIIMSSANSRELVGKTSYVHDVPFPMTFGGFVLTIRAKTIISKYLFYFLRLEFLSGRFMGESTQTTNIANINTTKLGGYALSLPPLAEQQRIVDRIESLFAKLDEAKQKAQDALDSFETRKTAILHKAFTGELTAQWRKEHGVGMESWDYPRFEDCILKMQNGLAKRSGSSGTSFVVLRLANLSDNGFVTDDLREILLDEKEQKNYSLKDNDVLMIRVNGSKDNVGKQFLFHGKLKWAFCDHIIRITYKTNLSPEYMVYFSKTNTYRRYIEDNMVSSAGQNTISRKGMASLLTPIPLMDEQTEIVRILDDLLAKEQQAREAAERVLEQIDLIKKAILARAFRGELGTNDPSEESAVELLKQISSC